MRALTPNYCKYFIQQADQLVDDALSTAVHITRCDVSRALGVSPGALVFHQDMLLDIPIIADLLSIQEKQQVTRT